MAARHEEACYEKNIFICFLVCKGLLLLLLLVRSNDDVGVARGPVFLEIRPGAGFKTGDFFEEKVAGATVESGSCRVRSAREPR